MTTKKTLLAGPLCLCLAGLAALLWRYARHPQGPQPPVLFAGTTMGTTFTVKVVALPPDGDAARLQGEIVAVLDDVDARMSTYKADSDVSRLNRYQQDDWFPISRETALVINEAVRIAQLTGGAFDVTVGPLVDLWSFGPGSKDRGEEGNRGDVPADEDVNLALGRVGCNNLEVRLSPPAVRKLRADLHVDLSAIAKGYAVDRVAELLRSRGVARYMVEVGGELKVNGHNAIGGPWQIAIERPTDYRRAVQRVLPLQDAAMATSGDYRNYFEKNGNRYSHIIDPRTGRPVSHRLASATVVDASCMRADALATALMVLGPDEGLELASREGLSVLLLVKRDTGFAEQATAAFTKRFPSQ